MQVKTQGLLVFYTFQFHLINQTNGHRVIANMNRAFTSFYKYKTQLLFKTQSNTKMWLHFISLTPAFPQTALTDSKQKLSSSLSHTLVIFNTSFKVRKTGPQEADCELQPYTLSFKSTD